MCPHVQCFSLVSTRLHYHTHMFTFFSFEKMTPDSLGSYNNLSGLMSIGDWYFPIRHIGHLDPHIAGPVIVECSLCDI